MFKHSLALTACLLGAAQLSPALAKDAQLTTTRASEAVAKSIDGSSVSTEAPPAETIAIAVYDGRELIWSGSLRIGGPYGSASFSQSRSEYAEPCPGQTLTPGQYNTTSENMNLGISRYNSPQQPDRFTVNLNWSRPVAPCKGEGNDSFGFSRTVTLTRGQTATVEGVGGMSARLTRAR
jgi:hypothetical protein